MLSTPDIHELPASFGNYFGRAVDFILTGRFYDVDITPVEIPAWDVEWQTVAVNGIKTTDSFVITPKITEGDMTIISAACFTDGILSLAWHRTDATAGTPSPQTIQVLAIKRERE